MSNSYIIELFRWNPVVQIYEKKDDCTMQLDLHTGNFKIVKLDPMTINSVSESPGSGISCTVYMSVNIVSENVVIISRERHHIASMYNLVRNQTLIEGSTVSNKHDITIDYEMFYNGHKFGIRFDSRSSAAEKNFFTEFTKLREKHQFVERYASGKKKIEGTKTNNGYNGFCIEYYDQPLAPRTFRDGTIDRVPGASGAPGTIDQGPIKYMGDFEDGLYDGEGEWFSADGNIRLICKNICAGKPNGVGKLIVGRNHVNKIIDMKSFDQFSSNDDSYTNKIYAKIEPKYNELMEWMNFENLSIEDRTMYLFQELQKLRTSTLQKPATESKSFFNIF
jgi:hypothetical protein